MPKNAKRKSNRVNLKVVIKLRELPQASIVRRSADDSKDRDAALMTMIHSQLEGLERVCADSPVAMLEIGELRNLLVTRLG